MPKKAFITGSTGFVGNAVARCLINEGYSIRALVRPDSDTKLIDGLNFEIIRGELNKPETYRSALLDCEEVYHVAALYQFYNPNPELIYRVNVEGTRAVLETCREAYQKDSLKKIIYTSTVGTLKLDSKASSSSSSSSSSLSMPLADENSKFELKDCVGHYKRSKLEAENLAYAYVRQGLPIVIVNPSAPVGARDIKPTPTGQMIVDFLEGRMPAYMDTGLNLVDVDDVALGHLLAAQHGKIGERYILGGENLSLKEILELLAKITGLPAPKIKIPYALAYSVAVLSDLWAKLSKKKPRITREAVQIGRKKMFFNVEKAQRELQLPKTNVEEALRKAVRWFIDNGYSKHSKIKLD